MEDVTEVCDATVLDLKDLDSIEFILEADIEDCADASEETDEQKSESIEGEVRVQVSASDLLSCKHSVCYDAEQHHSH